MSQLRLLLIEDSPDDVLLIEHLIERSGLKVTVQVIPDGETALKFLESSIQDHEASEIAHVILLDLTLPRVSGIEILRRLKNDSRLEDIPVIILSGAENEDGFRLGQELKAHTHIIKPMSLQEFTWIARSIDAYWPRINRLKMLTRN